LAQLLQQSIGRDSPPLSRSERTKFTRGVFANCGGW
jgi:hypothetical protein